MLFVSSAMLWAQAAADSGSRLVEDHPIEGVVESLAMYESAGLRQSAAEPMGVRSFQVELDHGGPHTLELRSSSFDAYLVVRDAAGVVLAEDDDGLWRTDARVVLDLAAGAIHAVDVVGLRGGLGEFVLDLTCGRPLELSSEERAAAEAARLEARLASVEARDGPRSPLLSTLLCARGVQLHEEGRFEEARALLQRSLAIREEVVGADRPETADSLYALARNLSKTGRYREARPLYERALAIREQVLGPEHARTAETLSFLGFTLEALLEYDASIRALERVLAIDEDRFGPEHPNVGISLSNLAQVLDNAGRYSEATPLYERGLEIYERTLGPDHSYVATHLSSYGLNLDNRGRHEEATAILERSLAIREKLHGPDSKKTLKSLSNLALNLSRRGLYEQATPVYERVLAGVERHDGPESTSAALHLSNLANNLYDRGQGERAFPLFERALAIREKVLGNAHPETALALHNLAQCHRRCGRPAEATPLLRRALAIDEAKLGPDHPRTLECLRGLAANLEGLGEHEEAGRLLERALATAERVLGAEHLEVVLALDELARNRRSLGREDEARAHLRRCQGLVARHVESNLQGLPEGEQFAFLAAQRRFIDSFLSVSWPDGDDAQATLQWRDLVLRHAQLGRQQEPTPEILALREELADLRSRISNLALAVDVEDLARHSELLALLRDTAAGVERRLAAERKRAGLALEPPRLDRLGRALPAGSAWVQFFAWRRWEIPEAGAAGAVRGGHWSDERLLAFVVRPEEARPRRLELGPVAPLEALVASLPHSLRAGGARGLGVGAVTREPPAGASATLRELFRLLWAPLAASVGDADLVLITPDGAVAGLPFGALLDPEGRYLIETRSIAVLTTGEELLRPPAGDRSRGALLLGSVDYALREDGPALRSEPAALRGWFEGGWAALPGTGREVARLAELFPGADAELVRLEDAGATEEALKQALRGKRWVHLATHGFFEPRELPSMEEAAREVVLSEGSWRLVEQAGARRAMPGLPPGLLSGLVCAGANRAAETGRDNGLLTASEVVTLDLEDCELVFLSACDTALGTVRGGQGMLSVQRAFHAAGARTVVATLWSVEDDPTASLVDRFYANLWQRRMPKLDALRSAQLELLSEARRAGDAHGAPALWAAFVLSGDWR